MNAINSTEYYSIKVNFMEDTSHKGKMEGRTIQIYINKVAVCLSVCFSATFSFTITYFCVTITKVLVQTFKTRENINGAILPVSQQQQHFSSQSSTFVSQLPKSQFKLLPPGEKHQPIKSPTFVS